jgi:uncharacterized protein (DUF2235 family)
MTITNTPLAAGAKRLALFLDGTWNTVSSNTNVWRLKSMCATAGADAAPQAIYYNNGLGTSMGEIIRGGVFGYGIDDVVINAYEWLIETFDDGDEIFIFGFSRGAYTARSLSGLISRCGLLKPGAPLSIRQLYERYKRGNDVLSIHELLAKPAVPGEPHEERWMRRFCREIRVKFTGVWDTVGALAGTSHFALITGGNHDFLDVALRRSEEYAFHALAIDEHRLAFRPTLYSRFRMKDGSSPPARPLDQVEQRWFVGAHANVGGGVDNDLLAQVPLKWLASKATMHGLAFRQNIEVEDDFKTSPIEDSFAEFAGGAYKILEFGRPFYRTIAAPPEERSISYLETINETIDRSVFDYRRTNKDYRHPNLEDWAKTRNVDLDSLTSSVLASDGKTPASD